MNQRTSGVLLHPTSLEGVDPIGNLGKHAYEFVNFLHRSEQSWWQMLPVGPTGIENSPYASPSAFAGNPLLICPHQLHVQGLLTKQDFLPAHPQYMKEVNYCQSYFFKKRWLRKAFECLLHSKISQAALDWFIEQESFWLNDYALFQVLQVSEGTADWTKWPEPLRRRQVEALKQAHSYFAEEIRYHQFIQWQFTQQWQALKNYGNSKHVQFIGDIPLFVAHQSADVWANQEIFKLDQYGCPTVIAGVPPDYFSKTGQRWNMPVYCWETLAKQNYAWWVSRIQKNMQRFDRLRLDHFIGFVRTYEIPWHADTAEQGEYISGSGKNLFDTLKAHLGHLPFIAEDLGAKTSDIDEFREQLHMPGMHVLQFELEAMLHANGTPRTDYPEDTVLYTGTHDNDTFRGWYDKLPFEFRHKLCELFSIDEQNLTWKIIREAFNTSAQTVIIPMQDFLDLPSTARMNVPGRAAYNWQWRMRPNVLTSELAEKLKQLTQDSRRTQIC